MHLSLRDVDRDRRTSARGSLRSGIPCGRGVAADPGMGRNEVSCGLTDSRGLPRCHEMADIAVAGGLWQGHAGRPDFALIDGETLSRNLSRTPPNLADLLGLSTPPQARIDPTDAFQLDS